MISTLNIQRERQDMPSELYQKQGVGRESNLTNARVITLTARILRLSEAKPSTHVIRIQIVCALHKLVFHEVATYGETTRTFKYSWTM